MAYLVCSVREKPWKEIVRAIVGNWFLNIEFIIFVSLAVMLYIFMKRIKGVATYTHNIKSIKNRTAEYYLSYYSLFVLALLEFSLINPIDLVVLSLLLTILGVVYIKNGLFFINPTINLFQSVIYEIEYQDKKTPELVISRIPLAVGDRITVAFSEYDFTFLQEKWKPQDEDDDEDCEENDETDI